MGRRAGNLKVEFIGNQKVRNLTFKRRKECLVKKMKELSTLCEVNTSMILYAPDHDAPDVWPPNDPVQIGRMIDLFWAKKAQDFKKDGACDEKAQLVKQFGVDLLKKAQLVRARINQLKSESRRELMDDADQQQDRFGRPILTTINFGI